jgi:erythromycin esterase-like protein
MVVRDGLTGSWERFFHELGLGNLYVDLRRVRAAWMRPASLLERAIGVIYRPETERQSHYFLADLPHQFDAILHYDRTRAVEPLERTAVWERGEMPETYPSSL